MTRWIKDFKRYNPYTLYAAKCSLKSEVADSRLSWLWWILDPVFTMFIYIFIGMVVFQRSEQYYPVFIYIGLTVWHFFEKTVKAGVNLVSGNKPIVSKVYLPKHMLVVKRMYINAFKMAISFGLVFAMLIPFKVPLTPLIFYIIPLLLVLFLVTFGLGCLCLHCGVFLDDLSHIVKVVMKLAFYLSGIFYRIDRIDSSYAIILTKCNPMAFVIAELRNVILYATQPDLVGIGVWLVIGLVLSIIGVQTIYKYENSYVKVS